MPDDVSREMLRQALIDQVPEGETVAGRICVAALRRAGKAPEWTDGRCYYAAEALSQICFGNVAVDDGSVTVAGSFATEGGCLREQACDVMLDELERTSPIE